MTGADDRLDISEQAEREDEPSPTSIGSAAHEALSPTPAESVGSETAKAPDRDPRLGQILSGFRLDALIGQGRTAAVYAASSQAGDRGAVKVTNSALRGDERVRRRLFREASLARRVGHPSVTKIVGNDVTAAGEPYVVMERLYGRDLGRLVRMRGEPFDETTAALVAIDTLELLEHCHRLGISHRNLAPFNIYLTVDGELKVFDFGSALVRDDTGDQSLHALATDLHGYLAPELLATIGATGDERCDLYSLGAVLFTVLTGVVIGDAYDFAPWTESITVEHTSAAAGSVALSQSSGLRVPFSEMPVSLATYRPGASQAMIRLVDGALRRDPAERFPTAAAMREVALDVLVGEHRLAALDVQKRRSVLARVLEGLYDSRAEMEKEETGAWRSAELLREVFRLVENVLYSARRHGWEHAETEIRLEHLVDRVLAAVADDPDGIFWVVRPYSLEYRGDAFWTPDAPFDKVTYHLFDSGFRKMHLLPGLTDDECRAFLRWLILDPDLDLAVEDDLATVFWRREFRHVRCELVSAVVLQDVEDYERLDAELADMKADAITNLRSSVASRLSGGFQAADAPEPDDSRVAEYVVSRATLLHTDPELIAAIGESVIHPIPLWRGRLAEIIARALGDSERRGDSNLVIDAFGEFIRSALAEKNYPDALELFGSLSQRISDPALVARLAEPLMVDDVFSNVLGAVVPSRERVVYGDELPFLADRLARLLEHTPAGLTTHVVEALARCTDRTLLAILLQCVERHAGGFVDLLAAELRTANALLGVNIIAILTHHVTPETFGALENAFHSPHAKVRLEAAEVLARYSPARALRELRKLIRHDEAPIRQRAVESIGRNKLREAARDLLVLFDERGFNTLPLSERRAIMVTACAITDEDGEAALARLVASHGVVADEDLDASRAVAIEVLTEVAITDEALEAVRSASRRRWWNTKALQAAAAAAVPVIERRLAELDTELAAQGRLRRGD